MTSLVRLSELSPPFVMRIETNRGPWAHPVLAHSDNSVRIDASMSRIDCMANMPRINLDGDTTIDPENENERIEVEG